MITVKELARDMFAAISISGEMVKTNANNTLQNIFGADNFNSTKILMSLMYTGDLPIENYLESLDIDEEFEYLDQALGNLRVVTLTSLGINLTFTFLGIFFMIFYCNLRRRMRKANELEEKIDKKMREKFNKAKRQVLKKLEREKEDRKHLLKLYAMKKRN